MSNEPSVPEAARSGLDDGERLAARRPGRPGAPGCRRRGRRSGRLRRAPSSSPRASRPGRRRRRIRADRDVDAQDRAGHRGDDSAGPVAPVAPWATAAARRASTSGAGARRNGDAPPGEVEVDDVAATRTSASVGDGSDGVAIGHLDRARRRRPRHGSRGAVEPPAARPRIRLPRLQRAEPPRPTTRRRRGCAARSVQSSGGQIRSSVSVRASPARTTGWRTSQRRNRRFVIEPEDERSRRARASAARSAVASVGPQAMILASIGSNRPPISSRPRSRHRPGCHRPPASAAPRSDRSPAGIRPRRPRRRAGPRRRGRWRWRRLGRDPERLARRDPRAGRRRGRDR